MGNFYGKVETGYLNGTGNIKYGNGTIFQNTSHAYRLRLSFGYYFHKKTSIGIGCGLDGYHNPSYNTMPLFVELKRFFSETGNSPFVFANIGYAVPAGVAFDKGTLLSSGLGYRLQRRKVAFLTSVGLNFQRINNGKAIIVDLSTRQTSFIQSKIWLKSIAFNVGLVF